MKYKRQFVSGMLAISLLTTGTTAFAAETAVRPSKVSQHLNQVKMKSENSSTAEFKDADGKRIKNKDALMKVKEVKKPVNAKKILKKHKPKTATSTPIMIP